MKAKILITGPPRSGKSTLVAKLIEYFAGQFSIYGFLTPEIRERNHRIGFDVEEISTKEREKLARIRSTTSEYRLGKYNISLSGLEKIISNLEKTHFTEEDLLIIDEIGKMELFSKKFQDFIIHFFNSNLPIIATIGINVKHPIKNHLLHIPDIKLLTLEQKNFHKIFQEIITLI